MICVYDEFESLSHAAAQLFVRLAQDAVQVQRRFTVALSGGHTPERLYELLGSPEYRDQIPWARVHVFWGDERCVSPDDPRSNEQMARRAFLNHVPISATQIHPVPCNEIPPRATEMYDELLHEFFADGLPRFDLMLLGLGKDGHTASLFPDSPILTTREAWVAEVYVPAQQLCRVTLTPALINQAAVIAFLVSGPEKAHVLRAVLEGPGEPYRLPAQFIRPENGRIVWLVDRAAASELSPETIAAEE